MTLTKNSQTLRTHWQAVLEPLAIRPRDLDANGHVNHAALVELFEAGRWSWMRENGLVHGAAVVPVVLKLEVNYRREVPFGSVQLETKTQIPSMEDDQVRQPADAYDLVYRLVFQQAIYLQEHSSEAAVTARIEVVFIDTTARRPASLADFLAQS